MGRPGDRARARPSGSSSGWAPGWRASPCCGRPVATVRGSRFRRPVAGATASASGPVTGSSGCARPSGGSPAAAAVWNRRAAGRSAARRRLPVGRHHPTRSGARRRSDLRSDPAPSRPTAGRQRNAARLFGPERLRARPAHRSSSRWRGAASGSKSRRRPAAVSSSSRGSRASSTSPPTGREPSSPTA